MTRRAALVTALLGTLAATASAGPGQELLIRHQRHPRRVYRRQAVATTRSIEFRWIHSVDHTPWTEFYEIVGDGLRLDCTELHVTGAGTPFEAPEVSFHGDRTRFCGLDRDFTAVRWIHSHAVHHEIYLDGELFLATHDVPHHVPAEMLVVGKRPS